MANSLPARLEEYTPVQAQSTFTEKELAAFQSLQSYIQAHTKDTIWWYWELGKRVLAIHDDASTNHELYGKKVLDRIARGLGFKTSAQLRNAMAVCKAFGTKKAFGEYIKLRNEAGNMLSWSHLVHLASVGDTETRMTLAAAALEQSWTAADLYEKTRELCERRARGSNVPKAKIPSSARSCLTHVRSQAVKFTKNYDEAWTGAAFDLQKVIDNTPVAQLTEKFVQAVQDTKTHVTEMKTRAAKMAELLEEVSESIDERLEKQRQLEAEQAAEEEGDEEEYEYYEEEYDEEEYDETELEDGAEEDVEEEEEEEPAPVRTPPRRGKKGRAREGRVGV